MPENTDPVADFAKAVKDDSGVSDVLRQAASDLFDALTKPADSTPADVAPEQPAPETPVAPEG